MNKYMKRTLRGATASPNFFACHKKTHDWSSPHIKRHSHCAQQQTSPSNVTKYCACHDIWHPKKRKNKRWKRMKRHSQWWTIWAWSDHGPTMIRARTRYLAPPFAEVTFRALETHFVWSITSRSGYLPQIHQMLPLPRKVTSDTATSPNIAPATKSDTPASQNWLCLPSPTSPIAPATKSDTLSYSSLSVNGGDTDITAINSQS